MVNATQTPISMVKFWGDGFWNPAGVWYADGANHRDRPCVSRFRAGEKPAYGGIRCQNPARRNAGHFLVRLPALSTGDSVWWSGRCSPASICRVRVPIIRYRLPAPTSASLTRGGGFRLNAFVGGNAWQPGRAHSGINSRRGYPVHRTISSSPWR